jgi:hypothetical protein
MPASIGDQRRGGELDAPHDAVDGSVTQSPPAPPPSAEAVRGHRDAARHAPAARVDARTVVGGHDPARPSRRWRVGVPHLRPGESCSVLSEILTGRGRRRAPTRSLDRDQLAAGSASGRRDDRPRPRAIGGFTASDLPSYASDARACLIDDPQRIRPLRCHRAACRGESRLARLVDA